MDDEQMKAAVRVKPIGINGVEAMFDVFYDISKDCLEYYFRVNNPNITKREGEGILKVRIDVDFDTGKVLGVRDFTANKELKKGTM